MNFASCDSESLSSWLALDPKRYLVKNSRALNSNEAYADFEEFNVVRRSYGGLLVCDLTGLVGGEVQVFTLSAWASIDTFSPNFARQRIASPRRAMPSGGIVKERDDMLRNFVRGREGETLMW